MAWDGRAGGARVQCGRIGRGAADRAAGHVSAESRDRTVAEVDEDGVLTVAVDQEGVEK